MRRSVERPCCYGHCWSEKEQKILQSHNLSSWKVSTWQAEELKMDLLTRRRNQYISDTRRSYTYVFAYDFLQGMNQDFPWEYFDVFFNVSRFRAGKSHNELEKFLAVRFGLRNCKRSETLEVSPDSIFLFDSKSCCHKLLQ